MIRFKEATNRNTKCYSIDVGAVGLLVSYETVVAASYAGERIRRGDEWGPTTKRHMCETNVRDYKVLDEKEFNDRVETMILNSIRDLAVRRLS